IYLTEARMTIEHIFDYALIGSTSILIFLFAVTRLALHPSMLRMAFKEFAECIGTSIVFFGINVVVGIAGVFAVRGFWRFLGLYTVTNFILVAFSLLQGFLFQMWWRRSRG